MNIGDSVHDIKNREWLTITKIEGDTIYLKGYTTILRKVSREEFERLVKSSPLN